MHRVARELEWAAAPAANGAAVVVVHLLDDLDELVRRVEELHGLQHPLDLVLGEAAVPWGDNSRSARGADGT